MYSSQPSQSKAGVSDNVEASNLNLLRNAGPTETTVRGPINIFQMDPNSFLSLIPKIKYLTPTNPAPTDTRKLYHAKTLSEARIRAMEEAGGINKVKSTRRAEWELTQRAALSAPDVNKIRGQLNVFGNSAWSATSDAIYKIIGAKDLPMRNEAAEDAALAMRLILLKDLDFEGKEMLILNYNAKISAWSDGVCVAACIEGTLLGYYSDALLRQ